MANASSFCKGNDINSIDLTQVIDVDSMSRSNCCGCGRDYVIIKTNSVSKAGADKMFLAIGEGPKVAKMVRDAVEECQSSSKLDEAGAARI